MKDYRKMLPTEAPEGLVRAAIEKGSLDTAGLTYEVEWVPDISVAAVLTDKPGKVKMVRCHCSECGSSFLADWAPLNIGYSGRNVRYGFIQPDEYSFDTVGDGDCTLCPVCQTPVAVRNAPRLGRGEFESAQCLMLGASLLEGETGERPFVLTEYKVSRLVDRYGAERYEALPMEAYVFDGNEAEKLNKWVNSYSGRRGYFVTPTRAWHSLRTWSEDSGTWMDIFGLTPELLEDSCMHNSKLIEYMDCDRRSTGKAPVPYLRQYQIHPQIENLITQGCGHIVNDLIRAETGLSSWEENDRGVTALKDIDWNEKRPAQMLRLNKDEFYIMKEMLWDTYHWRLYTAAKAVGDVLDLPKDIEDIHCYGEEDLELLIGKAPLGKCVRYLLGQIWQQGENFRYDIDEGDEEYDPYLDPYIDDYYINASLLDDYWEMARLCGWALNNPNVRWPKSLLHAHDDAQKAMGMLKRENYAAQFRERFVALSKYIYMSGDLMMVPADSQEALNREGEILDHCVKRYGEDHAFGKSCIFFIRHTWAPDKPFYTLQYDEKREKVLQNRGKHNCDKSSEVQAFEDEWLAWMRKGAQRLADGTPLGAKPVEDEPPKPAEIKIIPKETNAA